MPSSMFSADFASTTGIATSTVWDIIHMNIQTWIVSLLAFLYYNAANMIAWIVILTTLLIVVGVIKIIKVFF